MPTPAPRVIPTAAPRLVPTAFPMVVPTVAPGVAPTASPRVVPIAGPRFSTTTNLPEPIDRCTRSQQHHQPSSPIAFCTRSRIPSSNLVTPCATTSRRFPSYLLPHWSMPILDLNSVQILEYFQLQKHHKYQHTWNQSYSNKLRCLYQVIEKDSSGSGPHAKSINTFIVIEYDIISLDRREKVTYTKVICEIKLQKDDPNHNHITINGKRICYPVNVGTPTGSLDLEKLIFNSFISRCNACFARSDTGNLYLNTPLNRFEYARVQLTDIPD